MSASISTTVAARRLAERLLRDFPRGAAAGDGCGASCSQRVFSAHPSLTLRRAALGTAPVAEVRLLTCLHTTRPRSVLSFSSHFCQELELYERSDPEKLRACTLLREEAKAAFTDQRYKLAANFYEKILIQLDYTFAKDDEWKAKVREMELSTHMNLALTRFRLSEFRQAISHCNRVLILEPGHVKALVRRGLCHVSLCQYADAEKVCDFTGDFMCGQDFTQALEFDPDCATAREHLVTLGRLRAEGRRNERTLYSAMFSHKDTSFTASGGSEPSRAD
ncbi:peptidyl-prolyl cis-trans isomerase, putative [Babesia caballi]|uniref:Peptidyl-prolyl cis-trans isomerase, putative n=1 Tax=Babesia caballi TaxID=5871 RepID=A0AAV4LRD8_BABCB|nr:peptidyl-prolyl cis-trans isomerase, putative [Babesia caballi]